MAHKTGKKKDTIIAMILLLAATALLLLLVSVTYFDKLKITDVLETDTQEFTAIVKEVKFKDNSVLIYIEGYDWYLSSNAKVDEKNIRKKFKTLEPGERVYYRVASRFLKMHPEFSDSNVDLCAVFCALRTETEEIMSLDDYNRMMKRRINMMRIFVFSVAALTFVGACYCVWKLFRKDKKTVIPE